MSVHYLHSPSIDLPASKSAPLPRRKIDWTIPVLFAVNLLVFGLAFYGLVTILN